jgi:hypothetical protein
MHFVGMLAERVPLPVDYLVLPTLLSFLVCVIVVGAAVLAVSVGPPAALRVGAAAHYIGMETLCACARASRRRERGGGDVRLSIGVVARLRRGLARPLHRARQPSPHCPNQGPPLRHARRCGMTRIRRAPLGARLPVLWGKLPPHRLLPLAGLGRSALGANGN